LNNSFHIRIPFKEKIKNTAIWFDFNKSVIIKGFLAACALFLPIVFEGLRVESKLLFTLYTPIALAGFFMLERKELFWFGGFSGLLWFYWISFSLYYYDMLWLAPFVWGFAFFYYGALFWLIGFLSTKFFWLRILIVAFLFDYLSPLGFDWLRPEILYSSSYFGASKLDMLSILCGVALAVRAKKILKFLALPLFAFALSFEQSAQKQLPSIKIELVQTNIKQNEKWDDRFKLQITRENFVHINKAISSGADLVVLPETAFPYFLNESPQIMEALKQKSFDIAILAGALKLENNMTYNSSYLFKDGEAYIFDKVVAVPFGEVNPLPEFMSKIVNSLFFDGADDYKTADKPSDFEVKGVVFRNAICYEATSEKLYANKPQIIVAISNNAWFVPSFEPVIQKMLMRHLSKKYGTIIFHTANKSDAFIIN
jgi:apolipoprotein N-acyltransferase